jgi:hypothetical protein
MVVLEVEMKKGTGMCKGNFKYDKDYFQSEEYMSNSRLRFEELFELIPECGCWLWLGSACTNKGYGRFWFKGGAKASHRAAYELYKGPIPDGLHILHSCGVTSCVNPDHLRPGTNTENHKEKMERGRNVSPRGVASGRAILTDEIVLDIHNRLLKGDKVTSISEELGFGRPTVYAVKSGINWGWLTGRVYSPKREVHHA